MVDTFRDLNFWLRTNFTQYQNGSLTFIHLFCQNYAGSQQKFGTSAIKFDLKISELNWLRKVLKSKAFKNLSKPHQNNHQNIYQNTCKDSSRVLSKKCQKNIKNFVKRKILGPGTKISCYLA